ncbi:MAG: histidine kinase dimerization/phosphoacceptor domain -containing protein [Rhizonema sp. PD37]|nr:histidine kinase dimerization/phosphoacceptor domain -containing protein [Rhizonema sp. PD37]
MTIIFNYAIKNYILTMHPETYVTEVLVKSALIEASQDEFFMPNDCIFVIESSQLLGIFTLADILRMMVHGVNLEKVKIGEIMRKPVLTLERDFDINTTLSLMSRQNVRHLAIVDDEGQLLEIVTAESIATALQAELLETKEKLQQEIKQHDLLKVTLRTASEPLEQQITEQTEKLLKANKRLQRGICDRIATEAQLLQTTSELQELFQAFPDIYLRLKSDGTILSCHSKKTSDIYLPPEKFLGRLIQDVLPSDISRQFQEAISQLLLTNSLVAIEYSLVFPTGEKSFEARLLPSITNQIIVIVRNITERYQAQKALKIAKDELEIRVEERTYELKSTNARLRQEIRARQRIEEALRYRVEFEKLITSISTHFINLAPDEIDNGINQALRKIGEFENVERSYVFLFAHSDTTTNNTYEWCAKDVEGLVHGKKETSFRLLPWIIEKISRLETIHIPCVSELLQEEFSDYPNIQSLIILPIVCSGFLIGYLGFESVIFSRTWTEDSIALLKMVGEMLGNALKRKWVEQALRVSEERYARAINAGKVGIWEWNIQTHKMYIDPSFKNLLGYNENELTNIFDSWLNLIHPHDIESVKFEFNSYVNGLISKYEVEHRMQHKDGRYLWLIARGTVLKDANNSPYLIAGSNTDITERKLAETKLKTSLKEKEVLLKEIHHRVKNNLQIISSLLRLQVGYIQNEQTLDIFQDSQNRIRAMAMIHENLYQSTDLARIQLLEYVQNLTSNLLRCYKVDCNIKINLNIHNILLRIDTAIPCGLIINELVSNSIKYAFLDRNIGEISISFLLLGKGNYLLSVSDNGIGIPEDIEIRKQKSLGLQLVWNLVEQLEGKISFHSNLGTLFTINFSEPN